MAVPHNIQLQLKLLEKHLGWKPHAGGQREWMECQAPVKAAACGRRFGKSEAEGADVASYALVFPDSIQYIFAPSNRQTDPIFRPVVMFMRDLFRKNPKLFGNKEPRVSESNDKKIYLPHNNAVIHAWSANASEGSFSKRGFKAWRVKCDEAAYMAENVIDEVIRPMLTDYGGDISFISSPRGRNHFYTIWNKECRAFNSNFKFPSSANPHIDPAYLEQQRVRYGDTHPTWLSEYCAEFIDDNGLYIPLTLVEKMMDVAELNEPPKEGHRYMAGVDWAKSEDYTVLWIIDVTEPIFKTVFVDRFNAGMVDTGDSRYWSYAKERVAESLLRYNADVLCDSSGFSEAYVDDLERMGCRVAGFAMNYHGSRQKLIDKLRIKLDKRQFRLPAIKSYTPSGDDIGEIFLDEIVHFEYSVTAVGNLQIGHAGRNHHDDCIWAAALANWAVDSWGDKKPVERQELGVIDWFYSRLSFESFAERRQLEGAESKRRSRRRGCLQ